MPTIQRPSTQAGVTLMELVIVLAIIGILAGVGWSQYRAQLDRGIRGDGASTLLRAANDLEYCRSKSVPVSYAGCAISNYGSGQCSDKNRAPGDTRNYSRMCYWTLSLSNQSASSYTLTATRNYTDYTGTGISESLTLDHLGRKGGPWPQ